MKNKKFLSFALALAMVFTMSISAFASSGGTTPAATTPTNEFNATATVKMPTVSVTLPTSPGALFINPMGFDLIVKDKSTSNAKAVGSAAGAGDDTNSDITLSHEKVFSPVYPIINNTPMDLDVYVNPVATLNGTPTALSIATAYPFADDSTKNDVFIYAQFDAKTTAEDTSGANYDVGTVTKKTYAENTLGVLAVPSRLAKDPTKVGTIIKAASDSAQGVMSMTFFGDCNKNAKLDWVDNEGLTVTMTFTFKPAEAAAAAGGNG